MNLDYCGEKKLADPSLDHVFEHLSQLTGETGSFLVLAREDQAYIQACKTDAGYYVEFREGSEDKHYCTIRDDLSLDEAKTVFERYYKGDESFRDVVEFKTGMPGAKSGCLTSLLFFPFLWLIK